MLTSPPDPAHFGHRSHRVLIKEPLCEKPGLIWLYAILLTNSARGEKKIDERVLVKDFNYGRNGFGASTLCVLVSFVCQIFTWLYINEYLGM